MLSPTGLSRTLHGTFQNIPQRQSMGPSYPRFWNSKVPPLGEEPLSCCYQACCRSPETEAGLDKYVSRIGYGQSLGIKSCTEGRLVTQAVTEEHGQ